MDPVDPDPMDPDSDPEHCQKIIAVISDIALRYLTAWALKRVNENVKCRQMQNN